MHRLSPHQRPLPSRDSVSRGLKLIGSISIGSLLLTLIPLSASAARFTPVAVNIPAFTLPIAVGETLELSGGTGLTPTDQAIELNARITPSGSALPAAKFHVFGKHCAIIDGQLRASAPTTCTVIASRSTSPFAPISTSVPATYTFGSTQEKLNITVDTSSVVSIDLISAITIDTTTVNGIRKGQSLTLGSIGGSGTGTISFRAEPGASCIPAPDSATTTNSPLCTILPSVIGSVCSVVGNILTTTAATVCRVSAYKDGDSTYQPTQSDPISIDFSAGLGNQPIIITTPPIRAQRVLSTQAPLVIRSSPATASMGETITVTLSGGSGSGAYNFALYQAGNACTITRVGATAYVRRATAGNCSIQGLRSGDGNYRFALSNTLSLVWGQTNQSIPIVISNDPTSASAGETILLTTVGGQGGGAVTFRVVGNFDPACVLSGDRNQFLYKAAFGTCMIRATKAGDGIYAAQNSQDIVFTFYGSIFQNALVIDTTAPRTRVGLPINLSSSGGSGGGAVSFLIVGGTGVGTITGSVLTASQAGTIIVSAIKQGDQQYASIVSAPATFTFTV